MDRLRRLAIVCAAATIASALGTTHAAALNYEDISGRWCTEGGTEQFDRDNLIAVIASNGQRHVFPIVRYDYFETKVTVIWKDEEGKEWRTDFAEFSRERMVQLQNERGPRREFHRC